LLKEHAVNLTGSQNCMLGGNGQWPFRNSNL